MRRLQPLHKGRSGNPSGNLSTAVLSGIFDASQFISCGSSLEEAAHFGVIRIPKHLRRALHVDLAIMKQDHPIGNTKGELDIVRYDDAGELQGILQSLDQLSDDVAANGVQSGRGFVVEDHIRLENDGSGKGHTFSLAS